ncbi:cuticle protein 19-like [Atheta coriaria]|uniref:cuticle protein 19-like n=1 Tax=Dalotia coriaria TaxID=877792 RepID=UPI0031F468C8
MFFSKVIVSLALVALATAQHGHEASSYSSINSYNTHTAHDYHQAAPALLKVAAPIATYHHAPAPVVHAAPVAYHHAPAPIAYKAAPVLLKSVHHEEEHYEPAKYQFKYGVHDTHTHDIKEQEESRDGDVVKGYYSLLQPDGRTRIVHYTADKHNGFQAQVEYSGHADHPEVQHKAIVAAPVVHKAIVAAPVYKTVAAPVYKTAPVYKVPAYPHF